jgi:site-specific DNA-methyltransferase (adenine-specific)
MPKANFNPDVLTCLANLSNDEVFTPPSVANQMLDLLPENLWSDKNVTFLDPCTKSGIFLREITKRLLEGLKADIPDLQSRIDHILTKQVFGIGITQLTALMSRRSLYCSKNADQQFSITDAFKDDNGNILYKNLEHKWKNLKCEYCGASKKLFNREDYLEKHAYNFIHTNNPKELFNMKFDVIIGNPPYQIEDGGHGRSAKPIYHKFVQQAKKLSPRYLTMIIPARWYSGGKGLDSFRKSILNDRRIRNLTDFENSSWVFSGVDIAGGVCYFLWDRDNEGSCEVTNWHNKESFVSTRELNEYKLFIRHSRSIPIIKKIHKIENSSIFLDKVISPRKPFGLATNYTPKHKGITCYFTQKIGIKYAKESDFSDNLNIINKWKLLIPRAPIAGQTDFSKPIKFYYDGNIRIAKPGEICTESWLVACSFASEKEVLSFKSYLLTKIVRFLLLQTVMSQDIARGKFIFIPFLNSYNTEFTDEILINRWNITSDEWEFIDSKIS